MRRQPRHNVARNEQRFREDERERRRAPRSRNVAAPPPVGQMYASTKWSFGQIAHDEGDAYWSRIAELPGRAWPASIQMKDFALGDYLYPTFIEHQIAVNVDEILPLSTFDDVEPGMFRVPIDGIYRVLMALQVYPTTGLASWAPGAIMRMVDFGFSIYTDPVYVEGPDFTGYAPVTTGHDNRVTFPIDGGTSGHIDVDLGIASSEEVWLAAGTVLEPLNVDTTFQNCSYPSDGGFELWGSSTVTLVAPWDRSRGTPPPPPG